MTETTHTEDSKRTHYRDNVLPGMDIIELMDALQRVTLSNDYGSHDDQINLIRAEIARRTQA